MGSSGSEVPMETQFLLIESHDESPAGETDNCFDDRTIYTVCLPLLEGAFRTSLQGNKNNELEICVESGEFNDGISFSIRDLTSYANFVCGKIVSDGV